MKKLTISTKKCNEEKSYEALQFKLSSIESDISLTEVQHFINFSLDDISVEMVNLYPSDQEPIHVHIIQKTSKRRAYSISFDEEE